MSLAAVAFAAVSAPLQGQIAAEVLLDKGVFFEDEPIYWTFVARNVTADTVRVDLPSVATNTVTLNLESLDGHALRRSGLRFTTYCFAESCPGDPLPPGDAAYDVGLLQHWCGVRTELWYTTFRNNLPPGRYRLSAKYRWSPSHDGSGRSEMIVTPPVAFEVRSRTAEEEERYTVLVELHLELRRVERAERGTKRAGEILVREVQKRLAENPDDPFLPLLVSRVGVLGVAEHELALLREAALQVAASRRDLPSGASAAVASLRHGAGSAELDKLPESLAARIARFEAKQLDPQSRGRQ